MKAYLAALIGASLICGATNLSNAQTPPSTDRPKGESGQTSASPKMESGGMRATTKKAATKKATTKKTKKTRTARTQRAPAQKAPERDNWWDWRWGDDKGKKKQ